MVVEVDEDVQEHPGIFLLMLLVSVVALVLVPMIETAALENYSVVDVEEDEKIHPASSFLVHPKPHHRLSAYYFFHRMVHLILLSLPYWTTDRKNLLLRMEWQFIG